MSRKRLISDFLVGADPECFIVDSSTNTVKSAIKLIPGTKENPFFIKDLGEGFALQTDNILAEFNIPPTYNKQTFINHILAMQDYIKKYIKQKDNNLDIQCVASRNVPESELKSKQARMFGCDPDYCIYTGAANPKPRGTNTTIRSAGFHIHLGYDNPDIDTSLELIRYIDSYVGLPSIILDKDTRRRSLYGKAGCFRLTPYGLEYRSLSSYFMSTKKTLSWVWNQLMLAIYAYNDDLILPDPDLVRSTINNSDGEKAKELCKKYNICSDFLD